MYSGLVKFFLLKRHVVDGARGRQMGLCSMHILESIRHDAVRNVLYKQRSSASFDRATAKLIETEVTNKETKHGTIREIKIIDQFEDQQLKRLINKYQTCGAICGFLSCAVPHYLAVTHEFPMAAKFRRIATTEDHEHKNHDGNQWNEIVCKQLCDAQQLAPYVEKAMHFIIQDRERYIQNNGGEFENNKEKNDYVKAWVANYEISRYIQTTEWPNKDRKKYVVFLRCNQYKELHIADKEERQLILQEEGPFGKHVDFLVEFFEPRVLRKSSDFQHECKQRKIAAESILWILDLHGHYNCAVTVRDSNNKLNLVIMDTYTAQHCNNPAAAKCLELVAVV